MRIKFKGGLVMLVAMLTVGVTGVSSASAALPEFSPAGGTGKAAIHFTVTQSGEDNFVTSGGNSWWSESITGTGEITGSKEVSNLVLTYHGIKSVWPCTNTSGSIVTNKLSGRLGYINKAKTEVGLLLEPTIQPIAKCSESPFGQIINREIRGSWIGRISPVNVKTSEMALTYKEAGAGRQESEKFEAELGIHVLEWARVGGSTEMMSDVGIEALSHLKKGEEAVAVTVVG
jgi:hypothetical protein